jgi:ATPase subunit of ABC transporter with duplicated ATPase domains
LIDLSGQSLRRYPLVQKLSESGMAVIHDRYFIQNFATKVWEIKESELISYNL